VSQLCVNTLLTTKVTLIYRWDLIWYAKGQYPEPQVNLATTNTPFASKLCPRFWRESGESGFSMIEQPPEGGSSITDGPFDAAVGGGAGDAFQVRRTGNNLDYSTKSQQFGFEVRRCWFCEESGVRSTVPCGSSSPAAFVSERTNWQAVQTDCIGPGDWWRVDLMWRYLWNVSRLMEWGLLCDLTAGQVTYTAVQLYCVTLQSGRSLVL
jgi:hypothetical protein